ncbi:MAG: hypothetical protein A2Y11_03480 [Planctomycetes bacterium GWC2_39_26]|nr:MAG: hypothetical protein A2Y11_03480 [Planctomycetes bacterium GWC2_39_26]
MASVSNIFLLISNNSTANTRNVTVSGTMNFDMGEVGKSYRLEIKIFGEDRPGDNVPSNDPFGDDELYTFLWGRFLPQIPYKRFTVTTAGPQTFTETRAISDDKLDEDSGKVQVGIADINTPIFMPRADEVYAKVVLSATPSTARSNTVRTVGV